MALNSEADVEKKLIDILGSGQNQWNFRSDLHTEADLWANLRAKIVQNNQDELNDHELTNSEFSRIQQKLLSLTTTPFAAAKWLKGENGIARITIERDDTSLGSLSVMLFSNQDIGGGRSSYEVVHQIAKAGNDEAAHDRRFDVTLLINGLPIVQIELKQVLAKDGIYQAFNQIVKYSEEGMFSGNIFSTLQLFVISNEPTTRYFANAQPKNMDRKYLFSWRTKDGIKVDNLYEFARQVLNIPDAHRLIADYTIVSEDQSTKSLMVLHPYQIHAIRALYEAASHHKSGYVWHATGSGKTLTAFVTTKLLARKPGIDRTIMMIDRKDLDDQTNDEFTRFASEFNTGLSTGNTRKNALVVGTGSSRELAKTLLSDDNSNVIIITTRQKLDAALKKARHQDDEKGTHRYQKLLGSHIVFIVDECHRALSPENMEDIKQFFPNSTWFGFTGTPIFEENKREAQGTLARTTHDQYGERLHTYTIKNALDDASVLGFQVEHEDTIDQDSLTNHIFQQMQGMPKYLALSDEQLSKQVDTLSQIEREKYIDNSVYESDEHIQKVIRKILAPNNAYVKFDFANGRPQKSAILTTSSISMAKRYYKAIKDMTHDSDWMAKTFSDHPLHTGREIEDPDFPRIAITYSMDENPDSATVKQDEMKAILDDYNAYYHTSWGLDTIQRYNGDINNRLSRKQAIFREPGKQVDLVIVVDRLLTGFDAPQVQTLFVDRMLEYAQLIQAFSRTNRTFPGKSKGLIVTFRRPATMAANVEAATRLYSESKEESGLIYDDYQTAKVKHMRAYAAFSLFCQTNPEIDEHSDIEKRLEYTKDYQAMAKSYAALVTYDEYNKELEETDQSTLLPNLIEEEAGVYNTIKGSIVNEGPDVPTEVADINFYDDNAVNNYNIDSAFIDRLLGIYAANNKDTRNQIEEALKKMNKPENVRNVYRKILNDIDRGKISPEDDVFVIKRRYFDGAADLAIDEFSKEWCIPNSELHSSVIQYYGGAKDVPGLSDLNRSMDVNQYQIEHPGASLFRARAQMKVAWQALLDDVILPYREELR
ncbi:type I restriction endonuclease subunit R [Furfurilactobacillus rossiae]|uniref:Type I restriction enzyme endonuclease subunit n=1 Tax=Furfurilactobacillus rossiae DSM 15814 TaxID=1114972 RepID=A0A0R1RI75_9LACO|nr:HsdR family type I site-specific deoxyribonuclease [Furfurilactobacillus rossiae]KRL54490.1 Type IC restriction subunit [Furfurilactobacillus rossiae DSM 15814]QFR67394.1 HsdR family type I site-specific deoxyribonuclease [Furfurilactobacillus rossiae]QLE60334.1 Type I restriction-modification system restriction subunit R [Furfurilactobacillus rossiae]